MSMDYKELVETTLNKYKERYEFLSEEYILTHNIPKSTECDAKVEVINELIEKLVMR